MSQITPEHVLFSLTDVARLLRQSFEKATSEAGLKLTLGDLRTLAYVQRSNGMAQTALADAMGIEPMSLSPYIDRMETNGFITRRTSAGDRRAKVILLTDDYQASSERISSVALDIYGAATGGLSSGDIMSLEESLSSMRANLRLQPR